MYSNPANMRMQDTGDVISPVIKSAIATLLRDLMTAPPYMPGLCPLVIATGVDYNAGDKITPEAHNKWVLAAACGYKRERPANL